ncbi:MAG: AEC family transporter [Myxococcota bacterium]
MLTQLLAILAPIYICIGLGFLWYRIGRRYDTELVTQLITDVGAPCLVFSSLVGIEAGSDRMLVMVGATLAALSSFALVGALILRIAGLPATSFLAPLVFPNTGNMGLPVCLFAFGQEGLALAACFFATTAIAHFTVGQWLWSGRVSFTQLFRTPLSYAALAAAAVLGGDVEVPSWVLETTRLLGSFTIPLMQFTLGVTLARFAPGRLSRGASLSALRLGLGLGVGVGLAWLLGLTGVMRGVFILDCAMPVAVFNYMLAERYQRDAVDVAGLVVLSTLVSLVSLPLILAAVL